MSELRAYDPTARADLGDASASPLPDLSGVTVGFLWNNRPRGDVVLRGIAAELEIRFGAKTLFTNKLRVGAGAPEDLVSTIAAEASAAVVGVGD